MEPPVVPLAYAVRQPARDLLRNSRGCRVFWIRRSKVDYDYPVVASLREAILCCKRTLRGFAVAPAFGAPSGVDIVRVRSERSLLCLASGRLSLPDSVFEGELR